MRYSVGYDNEFEMNTFPDAVATPGQKNIPLGLLCGAAAGALWGLVFLSPELAQEFSPLDLAAGRYLAYGLIAVALIAPRWNHHRQYLTKRDWFVLFWLSFLGNSFYYVMLSCAVQTGGIALTSLVIGFMPVAVTIIGSSDHDAPSLWRLAPSLIFCVAGACCVGWQVFSAPGSNSVLGLACAIFALISWTGYAIGNSRALVRLQHVSSHDWNLLTGVMTGAQSLLLLPAAWLLDPRSHSPESWEFFALLSISVAVVASICGNAFWNKMSRLLPLTMTGQMILFETFFALIYGFLWERRAPHPMELAAFSFIVLGVLSCIAAHKRVQTAQIANPS